MRRIDVALAGELLLLLIAAPLLYFPARFPGWASILAMCLLAFTFAWRKRLRGVWYVRTPLDWPLALLLVMLPIAVWVAPPLLRDHYSLPRAGIVSLPSSASRIAASTTSRCAPSTSDSRFGFAADRSSRRVAAARCDSDDRK